VAGIRAWLADVLQRKPGMLTNMASSAAVILGLLLLRLAAVGIANRIARDRTSRHSWRKAITYVVFALGIVTVGAIWFDVLGSAATALGLISAGLIVALQGPVTNLAGWVFLVARRPLTVGDRVQVGQHAGDVVDIRVFQFTILEIMNWVAADQSTGRLIHIPNAQVFTEPIVNYSKGIGYIWNEVPVRITFESDWRAAKALLLEIAGRHDAQLDSVERERLRQRPHRYPILYSVLTPTVYTRVEKDAVLLTIRYLCEPRKRKASEHAAWEDVLEAFARDARIEFAYPMTRFYQRFVEQGESGRQVSNSEA
jgi:small-conductance mechanosensitive channel